MQPEVIESCSTCGAHPGEFCVTSSGARAKKSHSGRKGGPEVISRTNSRMRPPLRTVRPVEETRDISMYIPQPPRPQPAEVSSSGIADPERYRRATFAFAMACKEVLAAQRFVGTGVAKTALIDLEHGLEMSTKFIVPPIKGYVSTLRDVS